MRTPPRLPQSTRSPRQTTDGRGITSADVDRAADSLLRDGQRPTIEKVRARIGRGSPNTINPLLDLWWQRLAGRLDAGPAALHRLPEPVLHAAEALWLQCLDDARRRAQLESQGSRKALARERQHLEVQGHVLGIRETELKARIEAAEHRASRLELEVTTLTTLLRKEQASRLAAERLLAPTRTERQAARATRGSRRSAAPTLRNAKLRKQVKKSPRAAAPKKRTVTSKRRARR